MGCSQLQRFWLYSIAPPAAAVPIPGMLPRGVREEMLQVRAGSLRLASVPLELRVREVEWWLGRNSAGHLNPKTHVQRFMRQEALWL